MLASRFTSKYQATVPEKMRKFLGLEKGDLVTFELKKGEGRLKKLSPLDWQFAKSLESTFSEWESQHDKEAYRGL